MKLSPIEQAKRVFDIEAKAILDLKERLNESHFEKGVALLVGCKGKVVVVGMGKSGQICRKIAATLSSTGTPAFFLHPAEGAHGDLGVISVGDVMIAISNSGETTELLQILPMVKRLDIPLIALTGKSTSTLAKMADIVLDISIQEEACPLGLAPTASSTATLAMGDALAIAALEMRGFKESDFAMLHPAGTLGRKLLLRVKDLMKTKKEIPLVRCDENMKEVLLEITSKRLGVTGVTDISGRLMGIITDGDLRRHLYKDSDFFSLKAEALMSIEPKVISEEELAEKAIHIMEKHKITSLFITRQDNYPIGIIHLHDLLHSKII